MKKLFSFFLIICLTSFSYSKESFVSYEFGRGVKFAKCPLRIGGYFSLKYRWTNKEEFEFNVENLALLLYGNLAKRLSFFSEIEARNLYVKKREIEIEEEDDDDDEDDEYEEIEVEIEREFVINPELERIFFDYLFSDAIRFRVGKFITPIGLWNPIHLPPLKWTSIDPPASIYFFPAFTTGVRLYGLLPFQESSWEYSIFLQRTKGIDDRNNNVKTDNFIGGQIQKYFSDISLGLFLGRFKDLNIQKNVAFVGFSVDIPYRRFRLMSEFIYGIEHKVKDYTRRAYYIQGIYRIFNKNYLIIRNDYFSSQKSHRNIKAILLGWNYRPLIPISFKLEVQFRKDSLKGDITEVATSFSVLF